MTERSRTFEIEVLGRTLEHLGSQMYKRRDSAIAELIANCWDAGAQNVWVRVPTDNYEPATSLITITDDGKGMAENEVQSHYLVVGRNRRTEGEDVPKQRPAMGRKGIGKLAGFGIARQVDVLTWRDGEATEIEMDLGRLKLSPGEARNLPVPGRIFPAPSDLPAQHGTRVVLKTLKHVRRQMKRISR